jgi:hypothetical protein
MSMKRTRIFYYTGNVDDKYKEEAKNSLIDAGWIPLEGAPGDIQVMECTGPSRQTCMPVTEHRYIIVAQRDE